MEPLDVLCTSVALLVTKGVFAKQFNSVRRKPQIMRGRLPKPLSTRMIRIEFLVSAFFGTLAERGVFQHARIRDVMAGIQKLARFQQHFDDVLVHSVACRLSGTARKKEDIHVRLGSWFLARDFNFLRMRATLTLSGSGAAATGVSAIFSRPSGSLFPFHLLKHLVHECKVCRT